MALDNNLSQVSQGERDAVTKRMIELEQTVTKLTQERDAAVGDLAAVGLADRCPVCAHSISQTGIPCAARDDRPEDGSCDFVWRGVKEG